jgi:hypothetical protein
MEPGPAGYPQYPQHPQRGANSLKTLHLASRAFGGHLRVFHAGSVKTSPDRSGPEARHPAVAERRVANSVAPPFYSAAPAPRRGWWRARGGWNYESEVL